MHHLLQSKLVKISILISDLRIDDDRSLKRQSQNRHLITEKKMIIVTAGIVKPIQKISVCIAMDFLQGIVRS